MPNLSIKNGGSWTSVKGLHVKDGGSWKEVNKGYVKDGGSWKQFYPPGSPITDVSIPSSKTATGTEGGAPHEGPKNIFASVSLGISSITGGVGPYSYNWFRSGADDEITASGTTGSSVTLTYEDLVDYAQTELASEDWKVTVTDQYGRSATSNTCSVTIYLQHLCFASDTPIIMADGSIKQIGNIEVGDKVKCYSTPTLIDQSDPDWIKWSDTTLGTGTKAISVVTKAIHYRSNDYYELNNQVKVTAKHPFMVYRNGLWQWITVDSLKVGDILYAEDGSEISLASIHHFDEEIDVVSISVDDVDTYFAGSFDGKAVLVHNK